VKDKTAIFLALAVSMIGGYSFMRKQYTISVVMITLYVLFLFKLLDPHDFRDIIKDRVIDTLIASVMAVIFGYLLKPVWEHELINDFMSQAMNDNIAYYTQVANVFTDAISLNKEALLVARKNTWVSLANLSDAFTRMLSEPKSKQKNIKELHQFVVSNHILTSHIATLMYYIDTLGNKYNMPDYQPVINASTNSLLHAEKLLQNHTSDTAFTNQYHTQTRQLDQRINELMKQRQAEIVEGKIETSTRETLSEFKSIADQFNFILKVSIDIEKICIKLNAA
jgi:uncharacterized membrane protein YccC